MRPVAAIAAFGFGLGLRHAVSQAADGDPLGGDADEPVERTPPGVGGHLGVTALTPHEQQLPGPLPDLPQAAPEERSMART